MFELVYRYLSDRPQGASTEDLLDLVLEGPGRDEAFGKSFLRGLLAEDPRFFEDGKEGRWRVVDNHVIDADLGAATFIVVDVETTGQRIAETGITEIGAVKMVGGEIVDRFDRLVNPGRTIPSYVAQLTGISDAMVAGAPAIEDVLPEFDEFARGGVLVAHNAAFDAALLDHHARIILGRPLGLPSICTLKLARQRVPELERASLDALSSHFGVVVANGSRHRALVDAELTAGVLRNLLGLEGAPALRNVRELMEAQEDPAIERQLRIRIPRTSLESLPESLGVYRLLGDCGRTLMVARADNLRRSVAHLFYGACHLSDRQLRMLTAATDVDAVLASGPFEARVVEAEWIRNWRPEYNRSDRHLPRGFFVKLGMRGPHPRWTVTSRINREPELYIGPLKGRSFADDAARALGRAFELPASLVPEPDEEVREKWSAAARRVQRRLLEEGHAALDRAEHRSNGEEAIDASVLGRLGKLRRGNKPWLANQPDCVVVLPAAGGTVLLFVVAGGLCRKVERVANRAGLIRALAEARRLLATPGRRVTALLADLSTILAHRLREKDGEGLIWPLPGGLGDEELEAILTDVAVLLPAADLGAR